MNREEIYYKRGLHIINKLLNIFSNDNSFYKKRLIFMEEELKRYANYPDVATKDGNALSLTGLVTLLGMNKENVEDSEKHSNYNFSRFTIKDKKEIEKLKENTPEFEKDRIVNTKYDTWLNVINIDHPTIDYIYNVRNGLLHSEYDFYDESGNIIYVKNSNYTKFEGKLLLKSFKKFGLFYFGNAAWTGLSENSYIFGIDSKKKSENSKELDNLIDAVSVITVQYKLNDNNIDTVSPEEKLYKYLVNDKPVKDIYALVDKIYRNYAKEYTVSNITLSSEQKRIIKKMILTYYGNDFYSWDYDKQFYSILFCCKYLFDSRNVISEWVSDFIKLFEYIEKNNYNNYKNIMSQESYNAMLNKNLSELVSIENDKRAVFACRTSLIMMKAYHILYRLQSSSFEELDYNNIDFNFNDTNYTYTRTDIDGSIKVNDFSDDINKISIKHPGLNNSYMQNMVLCEIIRNSLAHGKVNIDFKIDANDNLVEYVVFEDKYHSKIRKIEMSIDKFEKFLYSEAFLSKYCILNKSKTKIK